MIKDTLKDVIIRFSNFHRQGEKKNIFLFSTPRSGSTWLMEIIASQPGFKFYDEPLNIRRENVKKTGLFDTWEAFMPDSRNEDNVIKYLKALEQNRYPCMNSLPFRRNHFFFTNRIIFKIHEFEHMINTVKELMDGYIVYLLRHPIATTVSRQVLPRIESFISSKAFSERYLDQGQIKEIRRIYKDGTDFDRGILSWCYQNLVPLNFSDRKDWLLITYEELLLNAYRSCGLMHEKLDLADLNVLRKSSGLPATNIALSTNETISIMTGSDLEERNRKLAVKWKDKISDSDEKRAFEILELFDIDAYSEKRFVANEKYLNFKDTEGRVCAPVRSSGS